MEKIINAKSNKEKQALLNELSAEDFLKSGQKYLNYHQHTEYSVQDGFQKLSNVVENIPEFGMACISDHGTMSGFYKFTKACLAKNIKPVYACEFYISSLVPTPKNSRQASDLEFNQVLNGEHILLIAENNVGLNNMFALLAFAAKEENFQNRPHITWEKMRELSAGIICTTACIGSPVNRPVFNVEYQIDERDAYNKSRNALIELIDIFGKDNLYLEIQKHEIKGEEACNDNLVALANEFGLKLTCGIDSHYAKKEHAKTHTLIKNMNTTSIQAAKKLDAEITYLNDFILEIMTPVSILVKKDNEDTYNLMQEFVNGYEAVTYFTNNCVVSKSKLADLSYIFKYTDPVDGEVEDLIQVDFSFEGRYYYQLEDELVEELFGQELMYNTLELGARTNVVVNDEGYHLPEFKLPSELSHMSNEEYFLKLANDGLARIEKADDPIYIERLAYEFGVIKNMGFLDYFLIVSELVNWSKDQNIWVGPGRGSAAGAIVSYLLGITKLDPIANNLLFERFLNPGRVSMPDIDVDFEKARRQEVIQHLRDVYGSDCVARVVTFGEQKAKTAIDDVVRNYHAPAFVNNHIKKLLPDSLGLDLSEVLTEGTDSYAPEFISALAQNDKDGGNYKITGKVKDKVSGKMNDVSYTINLRAVYEQALMLENNIRSIGQHACAIGITPGPIAQYVPQIITGKATNNNRDISVGVTGGEIDDLGLLKVDVLGLNNGDIVMNTIKLVNKRLKEQNSEKVLTLDIVEKQMLKDIKIVELFKGGNTYGLFQVEGAGMTDVLMKFFADNRKLTPEQMFLYVSTVLSLYRPGPMDNIPAFIDAMKNPEKITYLHPAFEKTLGNTFGFPVFQEQIMNLAEELSGFSPAEKDYLRKAMGKKDAVLLDKLGLKFIEGAVKNGMDEKVIKDYWDNTIIPFGRYAFNKSHSDCYTFITLTNTWLKNYFPHEYTASLLNENINNADKLSYYVAQARRHHIVLNAPSINYSEDMFSVNTQTDELYIGLRALKGVKEAAGDIEHERKLNGEFKSLKDLFIRMSKPEYKLNKALIEGLILSGAFDEYVDGKNAVEKRSKLISNIAFYVEATKTFREAYKSRVILDEMKV